MDVSRRSLGALAPWWPAAWLVTSAVLTVALLQIESGWFLAAFYIGLNACSVLYVLLGAHPWRDRQTTVFGWCVAAQLPVMLWVVGNGRRDREQLRGTTNRSTSANQAGAP